MGSPRRACVTVIVADWEPLFPLFFVRALDIFRQNVIVSIYAFNKRAGY